MTFQDILNSLIRDTFHTSIPGFRPELVLCLTIVVMLFVRVLGCAGRFDTFFIALIGTGAGLYLAAPWGHLTDVSAIGRQELFTGLLVYDTFTVYFRVLLLFFALMFVIFTKLSGIPDNEDAPDFYSLVLGATLGMCLMASANHVIMIFLAVEMASVPSYALAGMLKGRRQSSEAALKYSVYGAGAAGIMLYGLSLLSGALGSAHMPTMALQLADVLSPHSPLGDRTVVLVLGGLMVAVGLCFKLSAVPFHFWCPDVFEGASAEVNAFLSVASKAAALALLVRVAVGFGYVPGPAEAAKNPPAATAAASSAGEATATSSLTVERTALEPVRRYIGLLVAFLAAITTTFGNLSAYGQTNIKRLMAYSTISHAGYMMMPVSAAMFLAGEHPDAAAKALAVVAVYTGLYLFMNLGAFAIIAFLRNALRTEEIADYAGLVRRSPGVVICFGTILFSLIGLPPLAGFVAKFLVFSSLVDAMSSDVAHNTMLALLIIGGLNTVVSLFYYVRVIKVMTIDPEPEHRPPAQFSMVSLPGAFIAAMTVPVLALGIWWNGINEILRAATQRLFM